MRGVSSYEPFGFVCRTPTFVLLCTGRTAANPQGAGQILWRAGFVSVYYVGHLPGQTVIVSFRSAQEK